MQARLALLDNAVDLHRDGVGLGESFLNGHRYLLVFVNGVGMGNGQYGPAPDALRPRQGNNGKRRSGVAKGAARLRTINRPRRRTARNVKPPVRECWRTGAVGGDEVAYLA